MRSDKGFTPLETDRPEAGVAAAPAPLEKKFLTGSAGRSLTGFTLIELIVSFSIFIVLITLTTATFAQTLRTQRIVGGLSVSMNEVAFVSEQMAREIRTGTDFKNIAGEETIQFTNANSELVSYKKVNNGVNDGIARCVVGVSTCEADQDYQRLTSPDVKIKDLRFILQGNNRGDNLAPRITIVTAVAGPKDINVNLETTISARVIEGDS